MADQTAIVLHHQETNDAISSVEQLLMFDENHDDPFLDTFLNDILHEPTDNIVGHAGTDFPGIRMDENTHDGNGNFSDFQQNSDFVSPMQIPMWPVPQSPSNCTCCQTLREFFHINGAQALKLEIHGRLGIISHAIQEKYNTDMSSQNHEYHMFDFCQESISSIKQFLVQYCEDRKREGYTMLQDPLSNFYGALCIGLNGNGNQDGEIFRGNMQMNKKDNLNQPGAKSYIALQREKAGKMKLRDLAEYFHLPINAASKEMNICPSAIKNICRKEGLTRWPHRKIKSIKRKISEKKKSLNTNDADERARALTEIHDLEQRLAFIRGENIG